MNATESFVITLTKMDCPACGGVFAISQWFIDEARRIGNMEKLFACPYCHQKRGWGESEEDRLKKKIESLNNRVTDTEQRAIYHAKEAEHFRKSRDGMKGAMVRTHNRIKNGVCPCCQRTFQNLLKHMATKHPKFNSVVSAAASIATPKS